MRPNKRSEAHKTDYFGELVCSNSLRSDALNNAVGVLKKELMMLDSIVMQTAYEHQVPAGSALAVDRDGFAKALTDKISALENVTIIYEEVTEIPDGPTIICAGPLVSENLYQSIQTFTGLDSCYFYDAIAPIIEKDSIDFSKAYYKSRYDKNEASYINCAMNEAEFNKWYHELINAKCVPLKDFEDLKLFEGCMPVEEMARRGHQTLLFGPLKPVGLERSDNDDAVAVVQLRQDNAAANLYNMVGFQTHLLFGEQKRLIQMIPGLENANIIRYGVMHRNTYINAPKLLNNHYQTKQRSDLFFAGQIAGVEGYVESIASGLLASLNMAQYLNQKPLLSFPTESIIGSMAHYIASANYLNFQPMNANFGIVKDLEVRVKKKEKKEAYANRALQVLEEYIDEYHLND
jgi:methylenetetrahydrofolate--tRNA-(uracil-5-)-methyltransferase